MPWHCTGRRPPPCLGVDNTVSLACADRAWRGEDRVGEGTTWGGTRERGKGRVGRGEGAVAGRATGRCGGAAVGGVAGQCRRHAVTRLAEAPTSVPLPAHMRTCARVCVYVCVGVRVCVCVGVLVRARGSGESLVTAAGWGQRLDEDSTAEATAEGQGPDQRVDVEARRLPARHGHTQQGA